MQLIQLQKCHQGLESADDVSQTLIQQIQHADKEKCGQAWQDIARKKSLKSNTNLKKKFKKKKNEMSMRALILK